MTLTPARSGLARSGATRSGYPIAQGTRLPLYALSNVARSGATRSNYIRSTSFVSVGGVPIGCGRPGSGARIVPDTLTISDVLNDTPNTCHFSMQGGTPVEGQAVIITLGSANNARREFAGWVLNRTQRYIGTPANAIFDVNCIDYTWGLNRHKVSTRFQTATLQTIVATLVSTYAPGYTAAVDPSVAALALADISFTAQDLTSCLTQACKRTGTSWLCDEYKVVRVFTENTTDTAPSPINAVHPSLTNFSASYDLSQVVTRVLSEGGGAPAITLVPRGETILPVETPVWYESSGWVATGTQRIRYTGVDAGHAGSLVGSGAYPFDRVIANLASGSGIEDGVHDYAVSFVTSSPPGESLTGAHTTITVGPMAAPATAPTAGAATIGAGPDLGVHQYAVSFVTATGETVPGPTVAATSTMSLPPTTSPIPGAVTTGGAVDVGTHDYAISFVTAAGETPVGPISAGATTAAGAFPSPTTAPTPGTPTTGGQVNQGTHQYAVTFHTATGETTAGPLSANVTLGSANIAAPSTAPTVTAGVANPTGYQVGSSYTFSVTFRGDVGETTASPTSAVFAPTFNCNLVISLPIGPTGTTARCVYRYGVYLIATIPGNSAPTYASPNNETLGGPPPTSNTAGYYQSAVPLTGIPTGPSGTTSRHLYRQSGGVGLRSLDSIPNNTTTTYTDTAPNANLGASPPATTTATGGTLYQTVPLTAIEKGPTGTTARKLYRRSGGAGLRLLTTIANNSSTTYTDTTANASLGVAPPATSTAAMRQIPLADLPVGGPLVTARKVWGSAANLTALQLVATIADNTTTTYTVTTPDASLGAAAPTTTTARANQVQLTGIPVGIPATISGRNLYRTIAGGSQLKRLGAIADNTTTTFLDTISDAFLGIDAPTTDTSTLQQPQGAVLAGSTELLMAGTAALPAQGWAVIGNGEQVIRYTSKLPNKLLGIPATGVGSITATISYNSTATGAAQLTGIPTSGAGAIVQPVVRGDEVNLLVTVDDVAAQAALHAAVADASFDGVQEDYLSDNRLSATEARARGQAWLDLRKTVVVTVQATTRDVNMRSGRLLHVNLGAFNLVGEFMIQQVTEHTFLPALFPTFDCTASSLRFTFEDWLRIVKREGAAT